MSEGETFLTGGSGDTEGEGSTTQPENQQGGKVTRVTRPQNIDAGEDRINLAGDLSGYTLGDLDYEIEVLSKHPDYLGNKNPQMHKRLVRRLQELHEARFASEDQGLEGLTEGDRQLLEVLRQSTGSSEPKISDDELREMIEEAPTIEEYNDDRAIDAGMKVLNQMHGKTAGEVVESAKGLMKTLKDAGIKEKDLEWLERKFGSDPQALTLMGIVQRMLENARAEEGQAKEQPKKPKTKKEIIEEANRLLRGE